MNVLLFSMPDSFEHTPSLTMRMPNGALASLAGNVDPHHKVAVADLILAQKSVPEQHLGVVTRIRVNSDRLRIVTRELATLGGDNPYIGAKRDEILTLAAATGADRPAIPPAPPEALTDIRKIWDIGTDTIVFQTVQQLDGDVIFRVRRGIDLARQQVLLEAHQQACHVAMSSAVRRSAGTARTCAPGVLSRSDAAAASMRTASREAIDTCAPSATRARATARPRPRLAPPTMATFPVSPRSMPVLPVRPSSR